MATQQRFQRIAETIGQAQAENLCLELGGTSVYISKGKVPDELVKVLGEDDAGKLCQVFFGDHFHIPKADFLLRQRRDEAIVYSFYKRGTKVNVLALRWGVCQRTINSILAKHRATVTKPRTPTPNYSEHQVDRETGY